MNSTELYEIERLLWTNDPGVYYDSLRDDALLVFQETGVVTRDTAVAAICEENREHRHWAEVNSSDQKVLCPTDDTRVLIYKATARWNYEQNPILSYAAASTPCAAANGNLFFINKPLLPPNRNGWPPSWRLSCFHLSKPSRCSPRRSLLAPQFTSISSSILRGWAVPLSLRRLNGRQATSAQP